MEDDLVIDHYPRNRRVAIIGGTLFLLFAGWLSITAPAYVHAPDFMSARDDRQVWVAGWATAGVVALALGWAGILTERRELLADRLVRLGAAVVWLALAGATVVRLAL